MNVTVPLLCVNVPLLEKLPARFRVPEVDTRVPPPIVRLFKVTGLAPKLKIPAPAFVKLRVPALIVPPIVSVPAFTVICRSAFNVTAPVPRLRLRGVEPT